MANNMVPSEGLTGKYLLTSDLDSYYNKNLIYTCKAVRRLDDLYRREEDVFEDYYAPLGYDMARLEKDAMEGACIISLVTSDNTWIDVPSTSIAQMPDQSGLHYTPIALGMMLGPIHDSYDLTGLKAKVGEVVHNYLGVKPEITTMSVGETVYMSQADHESILRARQMNTQRTTTDNARVLELEALVDTLRSQIGVLETHIRNSLAANQP